MVIFLISDRLNSFEGADRISELLDTANNLTGDEFEAVETKAGDLQDWFFLKHGLEHYAVPKQFANIKTVGCRVFKFNGATVAQIMAVTDKEVLFYMFPSNDLGIKVQMENGKLSKMKTGSAASLELTTPVSWSPSRETKTI